MVELLRMGIAFLFACLLPFAISAREAPAHAAIAYRDLPLEAQQTLALIARGGPYPFPKDGAVFGNFERRLPRRPRGYYREYTVPTPGERHRGARRIVTGGTPVVSDFYYTDDHYASFRIIVH